MSFSVDTFKANIQGGLALSNLYSVELPRLFSRDNPILTQAGLETADRLNLFCKEVNLPGRQIFTNERQIGMKSVKQAYGYDQDDVSLTFYVPNNHRVKDYFEHWQTIIVNPGVTNSLTFPEEYCYDVTINQYSKSYKFQEGDLNFGIGDILEFGIDLPFDDILNNTAATRRVRLIDAFPTSMAQQQLNSNAGEVMELTVQLSYKNWRTL